MTSVFISHSSKDNYFVDFLIELLEFHRVETWADRSDLAAGATFTSEIEQALSGCENLLVIISENSARSPWVTREISHFRASNPDRPVIPLMLDAAADPDEIYEGLGLVTQLRFYESFLDGFRELLGLLGRTLFPPTENRKIPDRRATERRQQPADRRASSIDIRLRVGLDNYVERSGRNLLEPMSRWREVGTLVRLLAAEDSPLKSFSYAARNTGEPVELDFTIIQAMALRAWRSKYEQESSSPADVLEEWGIAARSAPSRDSGPDMTGAAYVIDDIVDDIVGTYVITPKDRRSAERRGGERRRQDEP
jgi:hypothetical protein